MREFADGIISVGIVVCAAMILVWLVRLKSQGTRAYVMASAFAAMGLFLIAFRNQAPQAYLWTSGTLLVLLLAVDIGIKAYRQERDRRL